MKHQLKSYKHAELDRAHYPFLIRFGKIGDPQTGFLTSTANSELPFSIERAHWTYSTPESTIRGNHAHKNLKQILIAITGQIEVETEVADGTTKSFSLDRPENGLYLPAVCWTTLRFSHNAVLLCLASQPFDERDYIRDYNAFKVYCLQQK